MWAAHVHVFNHLECWFSFKQAIFDQDRVTGPKDQALSASSQVGTALLHHRGGGGGEWDTLCPSSEGWPCPPLGTGSNYGFWWPRLPGRPGKSLKQTPFKPSGKARWSLSWIPLHFTRLLPVAGVWSRRLPSGVSLITKVSSMYSLPL